MDERLKVEFEAGDFVFAKMKSYPPWPAKVLDENEVATANPPKVPVLFLGTNELGFIRKQDLFDYEEFREKFSAPKKIRGFNEGLAEITKLFQMRKTSSAADRPARGRGRRAVRSTLENASEEDADVNAEYQALLRRTKEEPPDEEAEEAPRVAESGRRAVKAEPPDVAEELISVDPTPRPDPIVVKSEPLASPPVPPPAQNTSTAFSIFDQIVTTEKRVRKKKTFSDDFVADAEYPGAKRKSTSGGTLRGKAKTPAASRRSVPVPAPVPVPRSPPASVPAVPSTEQQPPTEDQPRPMNVSDDDDDDERGDPWRNLVIDEPAKEHDYEMTPILEQKKVAPLKIKFCKKLKGRPRVAEFSAPDGGLKIDEQSEQPSTSFIPLQGSSLAKIEPAISASPTPTELGALKIELPSEPQYHVPGESYQEQRSRVGQPKRAYRRRRVPTSQGGSPKKKPYIQKRDDETEEEFLIRRRIENRRLKKARKQKKLFVTAYGYWCDLEVENMMRTKPQLNEFQEIRQILQNKWRLMSADEKEKYRILAKEERRRRLISAGKINRSQTDGVEGESPPRRRRRTSEFLTLNEEVDADEDAGNTGAPEPAAPPPVSLPPDAAAVLFRRTAVGPVEARYRWWTCSSAPPGRRGHRENTPPRVLGSDIADSTAVFKIMAKTFRQMGTRLQKSDETCAASRSALVDSLMDGFFTTLTHLLVLTKHVKPLDQCFPKEAVENLLEKSAFLTPL